MDVVMLVKIANSFGHISSSYHHRVTHGVTHAISPLLLNYEASVANTSYFLAGKSMAGAKCS